MRVGHRVDKTVNVPVVSAQSASQDSLAEEHLPAVLRTAATVQHEERLAAGLEHAQNLVIATLVVLGVVQHAPGRDKVEGVGGVGDVLSASDVERGGLAEAIGRIVLVALAQVDAVRLSAGSNELLEEPADAEANLEHGFSAQSRIVHVATHERRTRGLMQRPFVAHHRFHVSEHFLWSRLAMRKPVPWQDHRVIGPELLDLFFLGDRHDECAFL